MSDTFFVDVHWDGRDSRIETMWIAPERESKPLLVFLHEGLGSIVMWKDFPTQLCEAVGCRGLVMSRWGYGQSTPRPHHERWPIDFLDRQARQFLPAFFDALELDTAADPPWIYGHSDGGSIALLYASAFPERVGGIVVVAPHIFVEDVSIASIERARDAYDAGDLRERLARYHTEPDSAFRGWNDAWLSPAFRDWNIEAEIATITAPVLAVQGTGDEYGSLEQIRAIRRRLPKTRLLEIAECGHSPHRDRPDVLMREAGRFILDHPSIPFP